MFIIEMKPTSDGLKTTVTNETLGPNTGPLVSELPEVPRYVVLYANACMPGSCWGRYGKVAVVETNGIDMPKAIHPNHKAVVKIVRVWDRRNKGTTDRCAYAIACEEAEELAAELNGYSKE